MATCDSDADDQIMNLQTRHARRRARQQRDRRRRSGCSGALCVTAVVVAAAWRVSGDFRRLVLESSLACTTTWLFCGRTGSGTAAPAGNSGCQEL